MISRSVLAFTCLVLFASTCISALSDFSCINATAQLFQDGNYSCYQQALVQAIIQKSGPSLLNNSVFQSVNYTKISQQKLFNRIALESVKFSSCNHQTKATAAAKLTSKQLSQAYPILSSLNLNPSHLVLDKDVCKIQAVVYDALLDFGFSNKDSIGLLNELGFSKSLDINAAIKGHNDLVALNYALTLENLEASFYQQFQLEYSSQKFSKAGFNQSVYDNFQLIAFHEKSHVEALNSTITSLGGTSVPVCEYDFSMVKSVQDYVQVAGILENTGVSAYDGAVNTISDPGLKQVAASIATVEGRHASYLNLLMDTIPFPNVTDIPLKPAVIAQKITSFIKSCPYTIELPVILEEKSSEPSSTISSAFDIECTTNLTAQAQLGEINAQNDIDVLNYALTLEHLEATFYQQGQLNYSMQDFMSAGFQPYVYAYLNLIAGHEKAHVAALTSAIEARNGTATRACVYNFGAVHDVKSYLTVAAALENTGASAYDGALNRITDLDLQQVGATIATVEARHAAFLNVLMQTSPFPNITEPILYPSEVVPIASQFLVSCPDQLTLPQPLNNLTNSIGPFISCNASMSSQSMNSIDHLSHCTFD